MDQELKTKWIEALRSGQYEQASGRLRREEEDGKVGFCCLGVACAVAGAVFKCHGQRASFDGEETGGGYLPENLSKSLGLSMRDQEELVAMNDDKKLPFSKIADWLEKRV